LTNQAILLQFDIIQGSATGTIVYSEQHNVTTNEFGLVNVLIGDGTPLTGNFEAIDWSNGPYFVKTSVDIDNNGLVELGTQEIVGVPFAFFAQRADSVNANGNNGEIQFNNNGFLGATPSLYWENNKKSLLYGDVLIESSDSIGTYSTAAGYKCKPVGNYSFATGAHTRARNCAFAGGYNSSASGSNSFAMGFRDSAIGNYSVAIGYYAKAIGSKSIALGDHTNALGDYSVAIGNSSYSYSMRGITIGAGNHSYGNTATAIGIYNTAYGDYSISLGAYSYAKSKLCFVAGFCNDTLSTSSPTSRVNTDPIFIIGNGSSPSSRHNAVTVLKNGNVGINTNTPDKLLTVNGDARVIGDIYYGVSGSTTTYNKPDFVFKPGYNKDFNVDYIEKFIKKHGHLPWVTAAKDEKNGINMTRMSFETLEAVENLQLQIIELNKIVKELQEENKKLKTEIRKLKK